MKLHKTEFFAQPNKRPKSAKKEKHEAEQAARNKAHVDAAFGGPVFTPAEEGIKAAIRAVRDAIAVDAAFGGPVVTPAEDGIKDAIKTLRDAIADREAAICKHMETTGCSRKSAVQAIRRAAKKETK